VGPLSIRTSGAGRDAKAPSVEGMGRVVNGHDL